MEHRLLRSFVAVAEELHFGRAARRLNISQPPLSMQLRRLEDEIGVRLLERNRRRVALTDAGAALLPRARHILREADCAKEEAQRVARGDRPALTIAYCASATHLLLPSVVPAFMEDQPGVELELVELRSSVQPEAIRQGRAALGLACVPVDARGLQEIQLTKERMVVVLPEQHALARDRSVHLRKLHRLPYVGVDPEVEPGWAHAALRAFRMASVEPRVVQQADSKIAMLGLVAAGLGVSVVSESMTNLSRRGVVYRPLRGLDLRVTLAALAPPEPTATATQFLRLAARLGRPTTRRVAKWTGAP